MSYVKSEWRLVIRVMMFVGIFGNGGIQYWLEQDDASYGPGLINDFREIGAREASSVLEDMFALFASREDYWDWERRMGVLKEKGHLFEAIERRMWALFGGIEEAVDSFIRVRSAAFDELFG